MDYKSKAQELRRITRELREFTPEGRLVNYLDSSMSALIFFGSINLQYKQRSFDGLFKRLM